MHWLIRFRNIFQRTLLNAQILFNAAQPFRPNNLVRLINIRWGNFGKDDLPSTPSVYLTSWSIGLKWSYGGALNIDCFFWTHQRINFDELPYMSTKPCPILITCSQCTDGPDFVDTQYMARYKGVDAGSMCILDWLCGCSHKGRIYIRTQCSAITWSRHYRRHSQEDWKDCRPMTCCKIKNLTRIKNILPWV